MSNLNYNTTNINSGCLASFDEPVFKIHNETNKRIYNRNIPSQTLQPYLDVRPVMTKYSYFPIVDPRKETKVNLIKAPNFSVNQVFNPSNTKSPYSGYATNINLESELKNQIFALQKCSQSVYVPSSNSDLYKYQIQFQKTHMPHELLFQSYIFDNFNPNINNKCVGTNLFYNDTRCQNKET